VCSAAAPWLSGEAELQQPCQIVEILLDRYQSPSRADDCHSVNSVSAGDWQILKEEPSRGPKYKGDRASERIAPFVFQPIRPTTKRNMHRALMPPWHRCQSLRTATIRFDIMPDQNIRFVHTKAGHPGRRIQGWPVRRLHLAPFQQKEGVARCQSLPSSSDDAVAQADSFVDFLNQNGGLQPVDLRPVLDLKWDVATRNGPDLGNRIPPTRSLSTSASTTT
jgi:hypothetical protein